MPNPAAPTGDWQLFECSPHLDRPMPSLCQAYVRPMPTCQAYAKPGEHLHPPALVCLNIGKFEIKLTKKKLSDVIYPRYYNPSRSLVNLI